jgi:ribosomal protein L37AE/L43A
MKKIYRMKCPFCNTEINKKQDFQPNAFIFCCAACGYEFLLVVNRYNPKNDMKYYWKKVIELNEKTLT